MSASLALLERTYEVTAAVSDLHIETAATHVFATARPVKVPTIVLHCDSDELLDAFKVVERGNTLTLGWTSHGSGHFFVEVHVPTQSIATVKKTSSGVATVHPSVLKRGADISLRSAGSGMLLVQDDVVEATGLSLHQTGSGTIQIQAAAVIVSGVIMTEVTGSGQVALVADRVAANCMKLKGCGSGATLIAVNSTVNITGDAKVEVTASGGVNVVSDSFSASRLHSQVTGSGSVDIHTHSRFGAATIESQVTGSGHIQVVGQGSTERHDVSITGSGTVNSTMCASACDVKIMGSGYANFSDLNQVAAKVIGSGRVQQLTLVRLQPPYEVVAMPVPTPTAMPESARNWLKKAIFG